MAAPHNLISMEERGCTPEVLKDLYIDKNLTQKEIMSMFNIKDQKVLYRWLSESKIKRKEGRYSFNRNFFDEIDTEEKAYWLGFVWCDGYVCKRIRNGKLTEYQIKISLSEKDLDHLHNLKTSLKSNHVIRFYDYGENSFQSKYKEARLMISNMHMGEVLYSKYGMVPNRSSISKLINQIPKQLEKHFIRGVFDAEGSVSSYYHHIKDDWNPSLKMNLSFYTYEELIDFIQEHFISNGLKEEKVKTHKRHKGRDMHCIGVDFTGALQVPRILDYLYKDASVYMSRKHEKYLLMKSQAAEREVKKLEI